MASTEAGDELSRRHRRQQLAIRAQTISDFTTIWRTLDVVDREQFGRMVELVATLVRGRHRDSVGVAARFLRTFRDVEGVRGDATISPADPVDPKRVQASLAATGRAGVLRAVGAGFSPQAARQNGLVRASGAVGRLALEGGRDTVVQSAQQDRRAVGWHRITAGSPCAFCATIASRGPAFKTERTASFTAHDHCACTAEPAYSASRDAWPQRNRELREQYEQAQREARQAGELDRGTSNDSLNAFRRSLSG